MKHAKLIFILSLGMLLIISSSISGSLDTTVSIENEMESRGIVAYTPYPVIDIANDSDFHEQATIAGWEGTGAIDEPYLIKGYNITNDGTCIYIRNVTQTYFKITGCYFAENSSSSGYAVRFNNVSTGIIENTTVYANNYGFFIQDSYNIKIDNCTFLDTSNYAIYLWNSEYTQVTDIDAYDCYSGLFAANTNYTTVTDAWIQDCPYVGIYVEWSNYFQIYDSTVYSNDLGGMDIEQSPNTTVNNCNVSYNEGHGIYLYESEYSTIEDSDFEGNYYLSDMRCGILVEGGHNVSILNNVFDDNTENGITLISTPDVKIKHNHITNNYIHGIYLQSSHSAYLENNTILNNGEGLSSVKHCGIYSEYSHDGEIYNCTIAYNIEDGIHLDSSNGWQIHHCNVSSNNRHGIYLQYCENDTFYENVIHDNIGDMGFHLVGQCGVNIYDSSYLVFDENVIYGNTNNGIAITECTFSNFTNNKIFENSFSGLVVDRGNNLTISDNEIYGQERGLYLEDSHNNTITRNIIYDNDYGLTLNDCENTTLYYNDIGWNEFDNVADNTGQNNTWDDGISIGNWYSNYTGSGTFTIPGDTGSIDHYPSRSLYAGYAEDITYQLGSTGNVLEWNCSALNGWKVMVYKDGVSHINDTWDGTDLQLNVDRFEIGEFNITVFFYHVSGHHVKATAFVTVIDTVSPFWTTFPDFLITELGEDFRYDVNASDPSGLDHWWINDNYWFTIDENGVVTNNRELEMMNYNLSVYVNDTLGWWSVISFTVLVQDNNAPTIVSAPDDVKYEVGDTGNVLEWQFSDFDPDSYIIYRNGTQYGFSNWVSNSDTFTISVDGLAVGVHNYTIVVFDGSGNSASHTVWVTVTEATTTDTTTTTTDDTNGDTTTDTAGPPIDPTGLGLAVAGLGAGVVIVIVIIYYGKKKASG